jgi:hypothetical protein
VNHINVQLEKVLNSLLKNQLDNILKSTAIDELIGESAMAQSYR